MAIVTVGIDLAKNVFAVHGVDEAGKATLVRPEVARAKLLELVTHLLLASTGIRTVQKLLGYLDVSTTMIYTYGLGVTAGGAASPLDALAAVV